MAQTIATPAADYGLGFSKSLFPVNSAKSTAKVANTGNETVFIDTEAAVTAPTSIRRSVTNVTNMYANNNVVPPASRNYIQSGTSTLIQLNEVWTVTDDVSGLTTYIPISCHMVIRMSDHPAIVANDVVNLVLRTVGCIGTGTTAALTVDLPAGITKLRKGITNY